MKRSTQNHEGRDGHEEFKSFVVFETSWFVFLLTLLLFTPRIGYAQDKVPVLAPGVHDQTLAQSGAPAIHYAISVPPRYHGEPVPLVLALHFGGDPQGAGRSMLDILIQPALGGLGAVIVAPDSLSGGWSSAQNEQAVNALLAAVEKSYAIDQKKVIVTGFSMGGAGTWYWAGKYPDRFSAAVPVSGQPTSGAWRVPVFAVHSRNDQVVPIGPAEQRIAELKQQGVNAQIVVLTGIAHFETYRFVDGLRQAVPWIQQIWKTK
jgi:pimeloyl-ACP methyl ester carboxylesterase